MKILQPKIDDGTLKVVSGQTYFKQAVTQGWKAENAQKRMDTLLAANYRAAPSWTASCRRTTPWPAPSSPRSRGPASRIPIVTGQDSEVESVKSIMARRCSTRPSTRTPATWSSRHRAWSRPCRQGKTPTTNDDSRTTTASRSSRPYLLTPVIVTKANAAEAYKGTSLEQYTK